MGPGEKLLVGLDVEEQEQIVYIGAEGVDLVGLGADERVGFRVEDGGEGVQDEPSVVEGDLEGLGECGRVDSAS